MYFSGIREAYDYQTMERWWVIYATYPEPEFADWMMDFPFDNWTSTLEQREHSSQNKDWDYVILIKDPAAYLHFRSRWHTEQEYQICHEDHNINSTRFHFGDHMPNGYMWDDNLPCHNFEV